MPFWPTAIAQPSDLLVAVNRYSTTLSQACAPTDTTLHLANAVPIQKGMTLWIDFEEVLALSGATGDAISVQRGYGGSAQSSHASAAPVSNDYSAGYHNTLAQEISALETSANQANGFVRLDSAGHLPTANLPANICYLDGSSKVPLVNIPVLTPTQLPSNICFLDTNSKVPLGYMPTNVAYMNTSNAGTFTVAGNLAANSAASVAGNLSVTGTATVSGATTCAGVACTGMSVNGNFTCSGLVDSSNAFRALSNASFNCYNVGNSGYMRLYIAGSQPTMDFGGVTGSLSILGGLTTSGGLATYPALQVQKDGTQTQKILLNFDASNNPTITAAGGDGTLHIANSLTGSGQVNAASTMQCVGSIVVQPSGAGIGYGQFITSGNVAGSGRNNPTIYSSSGNLDLFANVYSNGTMTVAGALTSGAHTVNGSVSITSSGSLSLSGAQSTFNMDSSGLATAECGRITIPNLTNSWFCIHHPNAAYGDLNIGCTNTIAGGTGPYLYSTKNIINFQANGYFTGSVSATAHNTHASGTEIADIRHSFRRRAREMLEDIVHDPIPVKGWALHPSEEGLHILVKRSETQVSEYVIPWHQFRDITKEN
jgi:hypothetical protein